MWAKMVENEKGMSERMEAIHEGTQL
ncbi:MAG: hypothetical protein C5S44_08150 [Candidatus Methanocomedens sp.]|nr:MAG: hypothetical protein C5S44_08150 [ANME-2 cluster archaeon]